MIMQKTFLLVIRTNMHKSLNKALLVTLLHSAHFFTAVRRCASLFYVLFKFLFVVF